MVHIIVVNGTVGLVIFYQLLSCLQWIFSCGANSLEYYCSKWYSEPGHLLQYFFLFTVNFLMWYKLTWICIIVENGTVRLVICYNLLSLLLPTTSFHLGRLPIISVSSTYSQVSKPLNTQLCLFAFLPRERAWELGLGFWWIRMPLSPGKKQGVGVFIPQVKYSHYITCMCVGSSNLKQAEVSE